MPYVAALFILFTIVGFSSCDNINNLQEPAPFQLDPPTAIKTVAASDLHLLFESQYSILDSLSFDFNQDHHPDYILLLKHRSETLLEGGTKPPSRIVIILESITDGSLRQTERNHRILFPINFHQKETDSYLGINKSGRFFQIIQSWTNQQQNKRFVTFEYSQSHKRWHLYNDRLEVCLINHPNQTSIRQKMNQGTPFSTFDIFQ